MIFKRFIDWLKNLFKSPQKKMEEYLLKLLEELSQVKLDTMYVIGQEKKAKAEVSHYRKQVRELEHYTEQAILAGDDADARTFIASRKRVEPKFEEAEKKYLQAKEYADRMRSMHDSLTDEIQELRQRRDAIRTKLALAETQETINSMNSRMSQIRDMRGVYEKLEAEADQRLDTAQAMARLDETLLEEELRNLKVKYGEAN